MTARAITVLIAEDHTVVREGLVSLINYQEDMRVVAQANTGLEAVRLMEAHAPDIALMDLVMPEMSGVAAIRAISASRPEVRCVVLTTYDGDEDIYRALEAGAKGYLLKDCRGADLLNALRKVSQGGTHIPPEVTARLSIRAMSGKPLSPREVQVLQLMAAGRANKEIAAALSITEGTVKTYALSIFDKLGVADRTDAVVTAQKRGILRG